MAARNAVQMLQQKLRFQRSHAAPVRVALTELEVLQAKGQVQQLELELARHRSQVRADEAATKVRRELRAAQRSRTPARRRILAPYAGVVSYERPLRVGAHVRQKQAILSIARAAAEE